jgi:hypothetical protein
MNCTESAKDKVQMAKKHTKKFSPSLAKKKCKLRFYLTPVRITSIKNTNKKNAGEALGKKEPSYPACGNGSLYSMEAP